MGQCLPKPIVFKFDGGQKYLMKRLIGEGGYAYVYEVEDISKKPKTRVSLTGLFNLRLSFAERGRRR